MATSHSHREFEDFKDRILTQVNSQTGLVEHKYKFGDFIGKVLVSLVFFYVNAIFNKDTIIYDSFFHREVLLKFISVIVLMSTSVTLWKLSARRVWQRARPKKRHGTPPAHHCLVASGNWHSQICRFSLYRQVLQTLRGWKILLHPAGAVQ